MTATPKVFRADIRWRWRDGVTPVFPAQNDLVGKHRHIIVERSDLDVLHGRNRLGPDQLYALRTAPGPKAHRRHRSTRNLVTASDCMPANSFASPRPTLPFRVERAWLGQSGSIARS